MEKKSNGALFGSIVIIIILIIGGIYLWKTSSSRFSTNPSTQTEQGTQASVNDSSQIQGDLGNIEADLNSTDLTINDQDLK